MTFDGTTLTVKSDDRYYRLEESGVKPNTVRMIRDDDDRNVLHNLLTAFNTGKRIYLIINHQSADLSCTRVITDVTVFHENILIVSFSPYPPNTNYVVYCMLLRDDTGDPYVTYMYSIAHVRAAIIDDAREFGEGDTRMVEEYAPTEEDIFEELHGRGIKNGGLGMYTWFVCGIAYTVNVMAIDPLRIRPEPTAI